VPHAYKPESKFSADGELASHVPPAESAVASSLITIDDGEPGVSVLFIRSARAESESSPFGVTMQEQQANISSAGSNA